MNIYHGQMLKFTSCSLIGMNLDLLRLQLCKHPDVSISSSPGLCALQDFPLPANPNTWSQVPSMTAVTNLQESHPIAFCNASASFHSLAETQLEASEAGNSGPRAEPGSRKVQGGSSTRYPQLIHRSMSQSSVAATLFFLYPCEWFHRRVAASTPAHLSS